MNLSLEERFTQLQKENKKLKEIILKLSSHRERNESYYTLDTSIDTEKIIPCSIKEIIQELKSKNNNKRIQIQQQEKSCRKCLEQSQIKNK
jgi:methyl coenzyme M reductase gamma subunit